MKKDNYKKLKEKLNNYYDKYPDYCMFEVNTLINKLKYYEYYSNKDNEKKDNIILFGLIGITLLFSFLDINNYFIYLFGFLCFSISFIISLRDSCSIFLLYIHGLLGIFLLLFFSVSKIISNPLFSDNGLYLYIYVGIGILFLIGGFIFTSLYSFNDRFKYIIHFKLICYLMFMIGIFIIMLFPYICNYIYNFKLF